MRLFHTLFLGITLSACTLSGCDSTSTDDVVVIGGPENAARDGSFTEVIDSENRIATLEPVMLGGVEQWLLIRGRDVDNPLLIYLHGGPGSPAIQYSRFAFQGLEDHFTVVTWDQRGCGKSYSSGIDAQSITLEQLLSDSRELIEIMRTRFGVDKVFLMGASWGSLLGITIARDYPDLIHAYIGLGQQENLKRAAELALEATLDRAVEQGNQGAIDALSAIQLEPFTDGDHLDVLKAWIDEFGFGDIHDPSILPALALQAGPLTEYTDQDESNEDGWRALYDRSPLLSDQSWLFSTDMVLDIPRLETPVVFISGRFDYKTPGILAEEYLNFLEVPQFKQMYWVEMSAHAFFVEQREAFHDVMINSVLPQVLPDAP